MFAGLLDITFANIAFEYVTKYHSLTLFSVDLTVQDTLDLSFPSNLWISFFFFFFSFDLPSVDVMDEVSAVWK